MKTVYAYIICEECGKEVEYNDAMKVLGENGHGNYYCCTKCYADSKKREEQTAEADC